MKRILVLLMLCLGSLVCTLQAQTRVTVSFHSAADQVLTVSEAGKLYFSDNYLYINEGSGIPYSFLLSAISKVTFEEGTGVENIETADVSIYPNPTAGIIHVHNHHAENSVYSLYSYDGRLLQSGTFNNDEPIDISRYAKGLYLLKIDSLTFKISKI